MAIQLNAKQYQRLVPMERHLLTATKARYISAVYKTTSDKLVEVYREVFNVNQPNTRCNRCLLDICTKLGKLYFEYKEKLEAKEAEEKNKEQEAPAEEAEQPQEQAEQPIQEDEKEEAEQEPADGTKAPEKPKKQTGKKKGK